MKFHNEKLNKQYNNILGALELARAELDDKIDEYAYSATSLCNADPSAVACILTLKKDRDYINEAIKLTTEWALKLDISIPTSSF